MALIPGFQGVFSADNIPLLKNNKSSLIINFDKRSEPGSHYVAFFKYNKMKSYYFDPLKLDFVPKEVGEYLFQYQSVFDLSNSIQSFKSTFCGFYCMLFIICLNVGVKYWENIQVKFIPRNLNNDKTCIDLLCKTIKILSKKLRNK